MADPTTPGRFAREGGRNRFTARRATVLRVERVAPPIIRVTVSGPEFEDFTSGGPADHVRVFFPDAATGELVAPTPVGPGEDGIIRPDRASIARDFTPLPRVAAGLRRHDRTRSGLLRASRSGSGLVMGGVRSCGR